MLDNSLRDSMVVYPGWLFSEPGPVWCVVKVEPHRMAASDDMRNVGDIVFIAKIESVARHVLKTKDRLCYDVQQFEFEKIG